MSMVKTDKLVFEYEKRDEEGNVIGKQRAIDEVDIQIRSGKDRFLALLDASSSRLRPVFLAAMTTILGMIPLINDDMFGALAVTIMGGLFIGTVITLVILPVFYSLFFKIKAD